MVSRVHRSWLAADERNLLVWLAARLPGWATPDQLTVLGVAGALLCGGSFWASSLSPRFLWLACLGLVINWFGDSLDGSLARYRNIERPHYGFFIDHTTDVVSQTFIFIGLGLSHYMRFDMACLMLMSYWIAALYTFIRAVAAQIFQISYFGVGPTEIRIGLVAYTFGLLAIGPFSFDTPAGTASPLDAISVVAFVGVFVSFIVMAWSEGRRLAALDAQAEQSPPPAKSWPIGRKAKTEAAG
jgi:phosphatidylglycerophosphate synthase